MAIVKPDNTSGFARLARAARSQLAQLKPENVKARLRTEGTVGDEEAWQRSLASFDPKAPVATTVVIPVYNTEEYLEACLNSVLGQTQAQIEVILVDDGSTDGSLAIEREYERRDPRVRVMTQTNLRQGAARNRGLREARGEYVYFMDSDDAIVTTLFEECFETCEKDQLDYAVFDTIGFKGKTSQLRADLFGSVPRRAGLVREDVCDGVTFWKETFSEGRMPFVCWLQYFRRSFLLENDLFFTEGIYFEDNDWTLRVYLAARRLRYLPLVLHRYRSRPGSNVSSGFTGQLAESCPKLHGILCRIGQRETTEDRIRMVYDAFYVLNMRFAQMEELRPDELLLKTMQDFAADLCVRLGDEHASFDTHRWNLATLASLCRGVCRWPGFDMEAVRIGLSNALAPGLPANFDTQRIAFCGMAQECERLGKAFSEQPPSVGPITANVSPVHISAMQTESADQPEFVIIANPDVDKRTQQLLQAHWEDVASVLVAGKSTYVLQWITIPDVLKVGQ